MSIDTNNSFLSELEEINILVSSIIFNVSNYNKVDPSHFDAMDGLLQSSEHSQIITILETIRSAVAPRPDEESLEVLVSIHSSIKELYRLALVSGKY